MQSPMYIPSNMANIEYIIVMHLLANLLLGLMAAIVASTAHMHIISIMTISYLC